MSMTKHPSRPAAQRMILESIRTNGPISRAALAKQLQLGKSTVSTAVAQLIEEGLVLELGETVGSEGGGRPARLLGFQAKKACAVGLDIGGTKIYAVVTDLAGNILFEKKVPTTNRLEELEALVWECVQSAGVARNTVMGLGVGVPGAVDSNGTVLRCRALQWSCFPLRSLLEERFPFPVVVANDVNAIAMGEQWLGAGQGTKDLLYIAFGTNIGGAVIANGQLVLGHTFRAGEVGYQLGRDDVEAGRVNRLGEAGVFESKASGTALGRSGRSAQQLFEDYASGEATSIPYIKEFILDASVVIATGLSFLNPQRVVLGGGVADSMAGILPEIKERVEYLTPIRTEICLSALGGKAGALGAVCLVLQSDGLAAML